MIFLIDDTVSDLKVSRSQVSGVVNFCTGLFGDGHFEVVGRMQGGGRGKGERGGCGGQQSPTSTNRCVEDGLLPCDQRPSTIGFSSAICSFPSTSPTPREPRAACNSPSCERDICSDMRDRNAELEVETETLLLENIKYLLINEVILQKVRAGPAAMST